MFKLFIKLLLLCSIFVNLHAQSGLSQQDLVSVSPKNLSAFEVSDTSIEIEFSKSIVVKSIHKNTLVLKTSNNKRLSGSATVMNNTLYFKPDNLLKVGTYEVLVQKLKLENLPNRNTMTEKINYTFTIPDINSISINQTSIEVKEGNQTTLYVLGTYSDSSSKEILNNLEWIIQDSSVVSISNKTLNALSEGATTIQAKFNNILSLPIQVVVYKEINGYRLPPPPDPIINNSTLLGIDFNANGIRDDVDRKIIETYQEPIKIELMISYSQVAQEILSNPIGLAIEHSNKLDAIGNCEMYLRRQGIKLENNIDFFENNTFNTKQRVRVYLDYNQALSGGVYGSSPADWNAQSCDFDVETMIQETK